MSGPAAVITGKRSWGITPRYWGRRSCGSREPGVLVEFPGSRTCRPTYRAEGSPSTTIGRHRPGRSDGAAARSA